MRGAVGDHGAKVRITATRIKSAAFARRSGELDPGGLAEHFAECCTGA